MKKLIGIIIAAFIAVFSITYFYEKDSKIANASENINTSSNSSNMSNGNSNESGNTNNSSNNTNNSGLSNNKSQSTVSNSKETNANDKGFDDYKEIENQFINIKNFTPDEIKLYNKLLNASQNGPGWCTFMVTNLGNPVMINNIPSYGVTSYCLAGTINNRTLENTSGILGGGMFSITGKALKGSYSSQVNENLTNTQIENVIYKLYLEYANINCTVKTSANITVNLNDYKEVNGIKLYHVTGNNVDLYISLNGIIYANPSIGSDNNFSGGVSPLSQSEIDEYKNNSNITQTQINLYEYLSSLAIVSLETRGNMGTDASWIVVNLSNTINVNGETYYSIHNYYGDSQFYMNLNGDVLNEDIPEKQIDDTLTTEQIYNELGKVVTQYVDYMGWEQVGNPNIEVAFNPDGTIKYKEVNGIKYYAVIQGASSELKYNGDIYKKLGSSTVENCPEFNGQNGIEMYISLNGGVLSHSAFGR